MRNICAKLSNMDCTFVLRDAPEKGDKAYEALYALWPDHLIYSTDFGGRSFARNASDVAADAKRFRLKAKLDATKDIAPLNGKSKISPLLPPYVVNTDALMLAEVVAEAHRLFPGIEMIYLDLGMFVVLPSVQFIVDAFLKFNSSLKIGLIASTFEFMKDNEAVSAYVKSNENLVACPFLNSDEPLADQLKLVADKISDVAHVFCLSISPEDRQNFQQIIEKSKLPLFVFWSTISLEGIDTSFITRQQGKPVSERDLYVPMRSCYSALIREHKYMDSVMIGSVKVGEIVKLLPYPPNAEGTSWGKLVMTDGKTGFVVVKHFHQAKFEETNHEHTKE